MSQGLGQSEQPISDPLPKKEELCINLKEVDHQDLDHIFFSLQKPLDSILIHSLDFQEQYSEISENSYLSSKKPHTSFNKENRKEILSQMILNVQSQLTYQKMTRLNFSQIELSNQQLSILNQALYENCSLRSFSIIDCNFTDFNLNLILKGLQNSQIQNLNLSQNKLQNPKSINKMITYQSLRQHQESLFEGVGSKGLLDLNLSYNHIMLGFVEEFCEVMQKQNEIKNINLKHNLLNKKAVKHILQLVEQKQNIVYFDLRDNKGASKKQLEKMLNLLKKNIEHNKKSLRKLRFSRTNLSFDSQEFIIEKQSKESFRKIQKKPLKFVKINTSLNQSLPFSKLKNRQPSPKLTQSFAHTSHPNPQNCSNCIKLEKQLLKSQQVNMNYAYENHKLKNAFKQTADFHSNLMNSLSAIQIQEDNPEEFTKKAQPESFHMNPNISQINQQNQMQQEDKLEYFMRELTQMMDYIENQNITHQFNQNSSLQTNEITQKLLNSQNLQQGSVQFSNSNIYRNLSMIHNSSVRRPTKYSEMTIIENQRDHSKISEKFNDYISETDSNISNVILGNNSFKEDL